MAVIHTDPFTAASDQELSAYDSAWVVWLDEGVGAGFHVVADGDRLECPDASAEADIGYMWAGAGSPTGDQKVVATVNAAVSTVGEGADFIGVAGRCSAGAGYVATIGNGNGTVRLWRVVSGGFTQLATSTTGPISDNTPYLLSLTITGTDPVHIEVEVEGLGVVIDLDDASGSRLEAGLPGVQGFFRQTSGTATPSWIDDWSVDDLQAGGGPVTGEGGAAIPAIRAGGTGTVRVAGQGGATAPGVRSGGAGTSRITALGGATLPRVGAGGSGAPRVIGSGSASVPAIRAGGAGSAHVQGTGGATLPALAARGSSVQQVTGAGGAVLPAVQAGGEASAPARGTGGAQLPRVRAGGAADVIVQAAGGATLPAILGGGEAVVYVGGAGGARIPAVMADGLATVRVRGGGGAVLPAIIVRGRGGPPIDVQIATDYVLSARDTRTRVVAVSTVTAAAAIDTRTRARTS